MTSCSNRELVEFFLCHRLSLIDRPPSLLRPSHERTDGDEANPSSSNGSAVGGGAARPPRPPRGDPVKFTLVDSAERFEQLFKQDFSDLSLQLNVTASMTYHSFKSVMDEVFKDGVNWGRVVGLFAFGGTLCAQCVERNADELVPCVADWMTAYLDENIGAWIQSQGGWESFSEIYGSNAAADTWKPLEKMKWLLVGVMLLTGVVIGVVMAKRR